MSMRKNRGKLSTIDTATTDTTYRRWTDTRIDQIAANNFHDCVTLSSDGERLYHPSIYTGGPPGDTRGIRAQLSRETSTLRASESVQSKTLMASRCTVLLHVVRLNFGFFSGKIPRTFLPVYRSGFASRTSPGVLPRYFTTTDYKNGQDRTMVRTYAKLRNIRRPNTIICCRWSVQTKRKSTRVRRRSKSSHLCKTGKKSMHSEETISLPVCDIALHLHASVFGN